MSDDNELTDEIARIGPERSPIRIRLNEYKGNRTLDIRRYYRKRGVDEFSPTRKGIGLNAAVLGPVLEAITEEKQNILDWLDSGSSDLKRKINRDMKRQLEAVDNLAQTARSFGINTSKWNDQSFFECSSEGGVDKIEFNKSHPFMLVMLEVARQARTADSDESAEQSIQHMVGLALISFFRASSRFSNDSEISANELLDSLHYEWGVILRNYSNASIDIVS